MNQAAPSDPPAALALPPGSRAWFVSDLHLWADRPRTFAQFKACVERAVREADALFVLGDLFEYWAGDDDIAADAVAPVVAALHAAHAAGLRIFFLPGNRDFLAGAGFAQAAGVEFIADPCVLQVGETRVLLMHGDLLCTDDVDYQRFRAQVRNPAWQAGFLAQPLEQRHALIAQMRARSEDKKARSPAAIMDVNAQAVERAFAEHGVRTLIHGHTHRPARHETPAGVRWVLPDWEFDAEPQRGGGLVLDARGLTAFDLAGANADRA